MAKQTINVGTVANDGTGSSIRAGGQIVNNNFDEIYSLMGSGNLYSIYEQHWVEQFACPICSFIA